MANKTKNILIALSLLSFIVIGILLIIKIGDIRRIAASTYDANGCPNDGKKWTYNSSNKTCTAYISSTLTCSRGYKWSSSKNVCYMKATYVSQANKYTCGTTGGKFISNLPGVGSNICTKNRTEKACSEGTLTSDGKCKITKSAQVTEYKLIYNANGGTAVSKKTGKNYSGWADHILHGNKYKIYDNWYTRSGYSFTGWNTKKDGTGEDWTDYINKSYTWKYNKNITLYAQWQKGKLVQNSDLEKCVKTSANIKQVTITELNKIKELTCSSNVSNTMGIEKMKSLETLILTNNNSTFSTLNLSNAKQLKHLDVKSKNLKSLSLANNNNLTYISVDSPSLTTFTLNNSTKNTKLNTIIITSRSLNKLNLKNMYRIEKLVLVSIGASEIEGLITDYLKILTLMNLPNLENITISSNKHYVMEDLTINNCSKLTKVSVKNSAINNIHITNIPKLSSLDLTGVYPLKKVEIGGLPKLTELKLENKNKLESLTIYNTDTAKRKIYLIKSNKSVNINNQNKNTTIVVK